MSNENTVTVELSKPVEYNNSKITHLTFREAEVGDMMVADKFEGQMSRSIAVLAAISDTPLPAFKKIKAADLSRIMEATQTLLGEPEPVTTGA